MNTHLVNRNILLEKLGSTATAWRGSWSHDLGDVIVFDAWEHLWVRDEHDNFLKYPLRTHGFNYNPESIEKTGHKHWQEHVNLVLNGKIPYAIVTVKGNSNKWRPFIIEGHVEIDDENQVWLHADRIVPLDQITFSEFSLAFNAQVKESLRDTSEARKRRLLRAKKLPERLLVTSFEFVRNPDVVAEVLYQAKGICGRCHSPAPFIRGSDESPYLEVHHNHPLSRGGEDTVDNAIALCPNCHRELHYGKSVA